MRIKCKVCRAALDHDKCGYCGTDHGTREQTPSQSEHFSNDELLNNDVPKNDIPVFDVPTDVQSEYSQPVPMMMAPKRRTGLAVTIGIICALLITGSAWIVLSASGESLNALELLERSLVAQADIDSMIMEVDAEINMAVPGMAMDIPMTMRMEMESEERMRTDMNIEMMGMDMQTTSFLRDGYEYTEENEFGIVNRSRSAIHPHDSTEIFDLLNILDTDLGLDNMITNSSASRIADGYRLEFDLDMSGLMSIFDNIDMMGEILDFDEIFGDFVVTIVMYLDEAYLTTSMVLTIEMEVDIDGIMTAVNMTMSMTPVQIGDVTIDFPAWLDELETSVTPTPAPTSSDFENSALLGYWENGAGRIFLWVFGEADSVEFLANGTLIITENGRSETVNWSPDGPGAFTADGDHFTYSIRGDLLTITDRANDDWSFDRGVTATPTNNRNNDEASDLGVIGTWEWDGDDDFIYIFNADGTATRGFSRSRIDFEWEVTDGHIINMHIGNRTEAWEAVLEDDVLTLSNLDNDDVWRYIRND